MRYAVLGTGPVGRAISARLAGLGHEVAIGTRDATSPKALALAAERPEVRVATFADAATGAEVVVNATGGLVSLDVLRAAGNLDGKVIVDISNPIDPASGFPPSLTVANTDSMGEQIQAAFPNARVVKSLNTINCDVMVNPAIVPGEHVVFVAGEDPDAKATVSTMLTEFGWPAERIVDLGGIDAARATEMYLPLWIRLNLAGGGHLFNIAVNRG
ncbi:MAG: 8-hydroxy-5-deazaflavin:NADPH oxidoreductase [Frankiales bacterium]|nr:8-hydroxy-5-deazaflavin:NADPH oxidoreductase [Frankiales bacterium]